MRFSLVITVLLTASPALATVGGGDITLKNTGGTVIFSHAAPRMSPSTARSSRAIRAVPGESTPMPSCGSTHI